MIKMAIKTNIYALGGYLDNVKITKMDVYKRMNEGMFSFRGWIERCENGKEKKRGRVQTGKRKEKREQKGGQKSLFFVGDDSLFSQPLIKRY